MPNFHQHVSCPTRGPNTLDHCYTQFKNAYKARSLPAFGKSDHAAIFLTPEYKQRIVQESPGKREVTRWSSHSEAMLQASLDDVDWDMFRASSADVSKFTDVALSFVNMLTDQATETVTIRTFSNQKPWVDRTIRAAVNQRTAAYNAGLLSGNISDYKASCYALRRAVRAAKLRYRERIESHFQLNGSRRMWQGLKTICSSGNNPSAEVRADPSLAEELNIFYGRFDRNGGATLPISASGSSRQSSDADHVITVSEDEVRRELRRVNIRKAAGPDGITGRILRSCADQLAGLFTSIFNESLATSVIPTSFKKSVILQAERAGEESRQGAERNRLRRKRPVPQRNPGATQNSVPNPTQSHSKGLPSCHCSGSALRGRTALPQHPYHSVVILTPLQISIRYIYLFFFSLFPRLFFHLPITIYVISII